MFYQKKLPLGTCPYITGSRDRKSKKFRTVIVRTNVSYYYVKVPNIQSSNKGGIDMGQFGLIFGSRDLESQNQGLKDRADRRLISSCEVSR